jgi:hypothetical protein
MRVPYVRGCIAVLVAIFGLGAFGVFAYAYADWLPESIRIQKEAEKSYQTTPVVPIDRPNSHHREFLKDGPAGYQLGPAPPLPGTSAPATGKRASGNK